MFGRWRTIFFIFFTMSLGVPVWAGSSLLTPEKIAEYLKTRKTPESWNNADENNADFPIIQILKAYASDQKLNAKQVVETLEPVLTRTRFELNRPDGGALRSYLFWRDLMYVILSRSFYEQNDFDKGFRYSGGVLKSSPFYHIAKIQQNWAALNLQKFVEVQVVLNDLESDTLSPSEWNEVNLQRAYLLFIDKKFSEAISKAESAIVTMPALKAFRNKLLAQSYFELHQLHIEDDNVVKRLRLEKIIGFIRDLKIRNRQSQFAYFAAEVFWTYASIMRIDDPIKNHKQIMQALSIADSYIRPWIEKSMASKKPLLPEEAMFLASVILWEQNKVIESIPRLLLTVELYPRTQYKEDSYQLIGDYFFEKGDYQNSLKYYSLLSRSENVEKVSYGIYKAAWAFYNLKEKFKALRHFQRLVLHHKKIDRESPEYQGSIYREAEVDMFFVMGELLTAEESLRELEIFKYSNADWDKVRERMSETYKKLGKFEESIIILKDLLTHHTESENYYTWLFEVLNNQLNIGNRSEIALTIEKYMSADRYQGSKVDFETKIVNLQLTLHREAKKTDDIEIWKATDSLYVVISQLAPNAQNGDFWYFGAQRKEMKMETWDALAWYKKAIATPNYPDKTDAANSILRIVKRELERDEGDQANYEKCKDATLWYMTHFSESKQLLIAQQIYLNALLKLKAYEEAEDYILSSLEKGQYHETEWNNYLIYNQSLYKNKDWFVAFHLADRLIRSAQKMSNQHDQFLRVVRQESSFQMAYYLEEVASEKNLLESRKWYRTSINVNDSNHDLRLKAWNNLLRSYKLPAEIDLMGLDYQEFKKENFSQLSQESINILVNTYAYVGKAYEDVGYPLNKFEALVKAADYVSGQTQDVLRWNALVGYGTHYEKMKFLKILDLVSGKPFLEDATHKVVLARIHLALGMQDEAWRLIQEVWKFKNFGPAFYVLLRDFMVTAEVENSLQLSVYQEWMDAKANVALRSEALLEGVWLRRQWLSVMQTFREKPLNTFQLSGGRSIASADQNTESQNVKDANTLGGNTNLSVELQFNDRLNQVAAILNQLVENKQRIKKTFGSRHAGLLVEALCLQAEETKNAAEALQKQSYPELNHAKWPHFVAKLTEKTQELDLDYKNETQSCRNKKEDTALLDSARSNESPLCALGPCPLRFPASEVDSIIREVRRKQKGTVDLIHGLIMGGAWVSAEYYIEQISNAEEKILASAYLRWAYNDRKSTYLLLKDLVKPKTPKHLKSQAALLLASVAWIEGANKKLQNYLAEVDPSELSLWQTSIFDKIKTTP